MAIFIAILLLIAAIAIVVLRKQRNQEIEKALAAKERELKDAGQPPLDESKKRQFRERNAFPLPEKTTTVTAALAGVFLVVGLFGHIAFYAEPGYIYHVRTIFGNEKVINDTGWNTHWFGRKNMWKKAMTVQAALAEAENADGDVAAEDADATVSANLGALNIMFLDQVDGDAYATARFRLPTDTDTFLAMAHEYRTPDNLLRTALIPAFKETLHATGSLMSAEEYYAGGKTEFNVEFENQMKEGIYIVKRKEVTVEDETAEVDGSANATAGEDQVRFGEARKTVWVVEKQYEEDGVTPRRKEQKFLDYGVGVIEARVTDLIPNPKFRERMQLKQKASADRAIAREQRIQEEEQRLLAIAKGDREVAEKQAEAKVEQIKRTTDAETEKQLALTEKTKELESAEIEKQTAQVQLEKARIEAETIQTLADANAYEKQVLLEADGALQIKVDAFKYMVDRQATALEKRQVPQNVIYTGGGENGSAMGTATELQGLFGTQLLKNLGMLDLNLDVRSRQPAAK